MSGPFGSTAWMANPASGLYGFEISNSLRFNSDTDSSYLSFTPSSAGNLKTWSWSAWVKKSLNDNDQSIFSCATAVSALYIDNTGGSDSNNIGFDGTYGGTRTLRYSTAKLRDVSAWYHVLFVLDTTDSTAANRLRAYVNGVEDSLATAQVNTYPAQDSDGGINTAVQHAIGRRDSATDLYFGGYLAEINFIDGTALTPSSFGETKNDIWIPKDTAGLTFGNQGFRLQFKQTGTSQNSGGIGADTSGNDNHWAVNSLVASDVTIDSPTNNFATLNPLLSDPSYPVTYSEGNLKSTQTNKYFSGASTIAITKAMGGKWYFEAKGISSGNFPMIGVMPTDKEQIPNITNSSGSSLRYTYGGYDGQIWHGSYSSYGDSYDQDIIGVAFDWDNKKIYFSKNGTWQNSSNPANGTNPAFSSMTDGDYYFYLLNGAGASNRDQIWEVNFGQNGTFSGTETSAGNADDNDIGDFLYDVPAGYLALCTANLPDPVETIDPAQGGSPQDYFNTVLYEGNGSTQSITGVGFQPDWVWLKNRDATDSHAWTDSVRGVTKQLSSDDSAAELTNADGLTAFGSDGFSLGDDVIYNTNNESYVAWNWKAGTAFSNDASSTSVGSIDSAGSVNSDLGFSIINFTGTGSALTVAHGLSQAPELIIEKSRDKEDYWLVYAAALGNTKGLILSVTDALYTSTTFWNDTSPTSTVWTMGDQNAVNNSGQETIAYCFHSVENYSKIGSYIGNGNADGPFVYTGFRPAFVMVKNADSAGNSWHVMDTARNTFNVVDNFIFPNSTAVEDAGSNTNFDLLSNGFKLRATSQSDSGDNFIYMAFAEQPFKYANAR